MIFFDFGINWPHIDDDIPLPKNATEALPEMTVAQEIDARTNTIKLLSDITDEVIEPTIHPLLLHRC